MLWVADVSIHVSERQLHRFDLEMKRIGGFIDTILRAPEDEAVASRVLTEVREMCGSFPAPGIG